MAGEKTNVISPAGYAALRAEYDALLGDERPKLVEVISWAAGNGDRSENGDYIYGRKRLREIDRRLGFLARRMKAARVVDPAAQPDKSRIWFGATVELLDEDDKPVKYQIVGQTEADAKAGKISYNSPLGRALIGRVVGDDVEVTVPSGDRYYQVSKIEFI